MTAHRQHRKTLPTERIAFASRLDPARVIAMTLGWELSKGASKPRYFRETSPEVVAILRQLELAGWKLT